MRPKSKSQTNVQGILIHTHHTHDITFARTLPPPSYGQKKSLPHPTPRTIYGTSLQMFVGSIYICVVYGSLLIQTTVHCIKHCVACCVAPCVVPNIALRCGAPFITSPDMSLIANIRRQAHLPMDIYYGPASASTPYYTHIRNYSEDVRYRFRNACQQNA
jgi:hypothetical protein